MIHATEDNWSTQKDSALHTIILGLIQKQGELTQEVYMAGRHEVKTLPSSFQADKEHDGAACTGTKTLYAGALQGN